MTRHQSDSAMLQWPMLMKDFIHLVRLFQGIRMLAYAAMLVHVMDYGMMAQQAHVLLSFYVSDPVCCS